MIMTAMRERSAALMGVVMSAPIPYPTHEESSFVSTMESFTRLGRVFLPTMDAIPGEKPDLLH